MGGEGGKWEKDTLAAACVDHLVNANEVVSKEREGGTAEGA